LKTDPKKVLVEIFLTISSQNKKRGLTSVKKIVFLSVNAVNIFQKYLNNTIFVLSLHFPIDVIHITLTCVFGYNQHMLSTRTAR
jgi:hypothetical protein